MITWADVVEIVPSVTALPVAQQAAFVALANETVDDNWFGETSTLTKLARVYLCAHYASMGLAVIGSGFDGGQVASESAGSLSVSYVAVTGVSRALLSTTVWGRLYLSITASIRAPWVIL